MVIVKIFFVKVSKYFLSKVAVGKAHIVALTKEGDIYTFGMNNKGQCGRDFPPPKDSSSDQNLIVAGSTGSALAHPAAALVSEAVDDLGSDPDVDVEHDGKYYDWTRWFQNRAKKYFTIEADKSLVLREDLWANLLNSQLS